MSQFNQPVLSPCRSWTVYANTAIYLIQIQSGELYSHQTRKSGAEQVWADKASETSLSPFSMYSFVYNLCPSLSSSSPYPIFASRLYWGLYRMAFWITASSPTVSDCRIRSFGKFLVWSCNLQPRNEKKERKKERKSRAVGVTT